MPYHTPETTPAEFLCRRLRIPKDIGYIMAVNGALAELTKAYNWEQFGAVTPEDAASAMLDMLLDTFDSECPDETPEAGEMLRFTPDAALITYAPQDPFAASETVPTGYVMPPLYVLPEGQIPFPGTQPGDVLTDLSKLPTAWPPLLPPDGYPRFRVHFHVAGPGPGQVELHLVKLPLAGLALITLDDDPLSADFVELDTANLLDLTQLNALLGTVLDGDLVRTHIQEFWVNEIGNHHIDVTFLPKITTESLLGFGGGLRQVVLGGTAGAGEMPAPQFRLTDGVLEWRPSDGHVWVALGDLTGPTGIPGTPITDVEVETLAPGSPATAELVDGVLELGIPAGEQGEQGPPGSTAGLTATEVVELPYDGIPQLTYDSGLGKLTLQIPVGEPPEQPGILATVVDELAYNAAAYLQFNPVTKTLRLGHPTGFPPEQPGILATVVQEVDYDDPAALTFNPANKTLTLQHPGIPPDLPDITSTEVVRVGANDPAQLVYTPANKRLSLYLPSGYVAGITDPAPAPRPAPPVGQSQKCLAAANAENVIFQTYTEMAPQWPGEFTNSVAALLLGQDIADFLTSLLGPVYLGADFGIRFLQALAVGVNFDLFAYDEDTREAMREILWNNLTLNGDVPHVDYDNVLASVNAEGAVGAWPGIRLIVEAIGPAGLDLAAATTAIMDAFCGELICRPLPSTQLTASATGHPHMQGSAGTGLYVHNGAWCFGWTINSYWDIDVDAYVRDGVVTRFSHYNDYVNSGITLRFTCLETGYSEVRSTSNAPGWKDINLSAFPAFHGKLRVTLLTANDDHVMRCRAIKVYGTCP